MDCSRPLVSVRRRRLDHCHQDHCHPDKKEQDLRDRVAQLEHELRLAEARANLGGLGEKKAEPTPRRMSRQERRRKSRE